MDIPLGDPFPLKIVEHKYLPPGTILVSSDIAAFLREKYLEDGKDNEFLRRIGIVETPPVIPS